MTGDLTTATPTPLRTGFIGCGRHAQAYLYPSLAALGEPVVAIATRDEGRATAAAERWGAARGYGDHRQMLAAENLDVVFVSVNEQDHPRLVEDCLRAGAHVFVEKPLGVTETEARRVAALAAEVDRTVMVAFMKRFAPAYREMHRIITDADTFGTAIGFHGAFDFVPWSPHLDDAGWVRLVGIHMLDLLRSLFGEVVDVAAISNNAGPDLSMALALRFPRGVTGTMNFTALRDPSRNVESLSIHGEKGTAQVERGRLLSCRLDGHAPALNQLPASTDEAFIRGFVGEIEHFYACIRGGRSPESSAADNIGTTVLCDRIVAQVQSTRL